jgi:hypothetical protein
MRAATLATLLGISVLTAAPARAQLAADEPIGRYVVDVRGALLSVPSSGELAADNGLLTTNLPGLGLGVDVAAHVYPLRFKAVTFGLGAQLTLARATAGPNTLEDGTTTGTDVTAKFTAVSPQVSLNFGSKAGWSYLSGGMGLATLFFETPQSDPEQEVPRRTTINFGGGGRWFLKEHMAFSFDLRFYMMPPVAADTHIAQSPRLRVMVFSAGVSFR